MKLFFEFSDTTKIANFALILMLAEFKGCVK